MLELCLLGSFSFASDGIPLRRLRSSIGPRLLALLALQHGRPVQRDHLSGLLWPDSTEAQALYNLRRNLTDLRTVLGADASRLQTPTRATVALDLTGVHCDVLLFDAAIRRGDRAALETAISLYRGPLMEGCYDEWILPERQSREADYLLGLETLASGTSPAESVRYLRLLLAKDPAQEVIQRRLMQMLADLGDHAGVTRVYRSFRRYLKTELAAEPAGETVALVRRLRAEGRHAILTMTAVAPPALRLPETGTTLIGRTAERRAVAQALEEAGLVTLVGTGGVGKTRLALATARDAHGRFLDGIWFVDLSAVFDPELLVVTVASALDVPPAQDRTQTDALAKHLKSRSLLLVLDNCEQVREAVAALAARLLRDCPSVRFLITSRVPIGLKPKVTYRVPSLAVPSENVSSEMLTGYAAVGLFLDRACAVAPHFVLDAVTGPLIARICRRLDGIPLAIELAAARIRTLAPEVIASHLDQQFRLLTGTHPGRLRRQQTLAASLDWSWDLLDISERAALSRMAVFAGACTLEAAEAALAADPIEQWEVLDLLARLVEWGLIVVENGADGERYRLLEAVRQYAAEHLKDSRQADETRRRHRDFFLAHAEQAVSRLEGAETAEWVALLKDAHDDLRAALSWNLGNPGEPQIGLRLAGALWRFWWLCGHLTEGRRHLQNALAADKLQEPTKERAIAVNAAGALAFLQGDYTDAWRHHQESLRLWKLLDDARGIAGALGNLGNLAYRQGDLEVAEELFLRAQPVFAELGETRREAQTLHCLANIADARGEILLARTRSQQALAAVREGGGGSLSITILSCLCDSAYFPDDLTEAQAHGMEALELARRTGVHGQEIFPLVALAQLNCDRADWAAAREFLREAIRLVSELDLAHEAASVLEGAATVVWQEDLYDQAVRLWAAASAQRGEIGSPHTFRRQATWEDLLARVRTELGQGRFDAAWQQGRLISWRQALDEASVIL